MRGSVWENCCAPLSPDCMTAACGSSCPVWRRGFDLWAAAEVLALRDRGRCPDAAVAAVIPFRGQERGYAPASLDEYRFICARAVAVRVLSDRYYPECFYRRNDFLVDNASVVVGYYDGQRGGTAYTFRRAYSRGVPVVNICSGEPALFYP